MCAKIRKNGVSFILNRNLSENKNFEIFNKIFEITKKNTLKQ